MNKLFLATTIWIFLAGNLFAVQDLNTPRSFPKIESKAEWQKRAQEIREQILVSCGLWPMPQKTPLKAHVFGKMIRDGYSIEKVYFQSYPGFYVAGNLYRPIGKGKFPAILNPHGHWENGRMADTNTGSIAGRCINFAKQGMIAFSYDMVGYNDTFFPDHGENISTKDFYKRHRGFATNETNLLWNINLMGLQTWNSIRALDFLESLRDVDKSRLACTGESGGGTQTFMLGAIDNRLAAQAPVVMVSHSMQGGCSCENAPGLRIEYSNMEIAAAAAPRPQIMIGATGDWTKTMMTIEGPAVESVYRLFDERNARPHPGPLPRGEGEDNLRYVIFDFPHNYNQTSREAVYNFFGRILKPRAPSSRETDFKKEADETLRVFSEGKLPDDAVSEAAFIAANIAQSKAVLTSLQPRNKKSLAKYKEIFTPAWIHTLQLNNPSRMPAPETIHLDIDGKVPTGAEVESGIKTNSSIYFAPWKSQPIGIVVLAHPKGKAIYLDEKGNPTGLAKLLVQRGFKVLVLDFPEATDSATNQVDLFFTTYNRTFAQERVRDLVNACEWVKDSGYRAILCGNGRAGLWTLLAAPASDAVIADCNALDFSSDAAQLENDLFVPGLRKIGGFEGVAGLAMPNPLILHNAQFPLGGIEDIYSTMQNRHFTGEKNLLSDETLAQRIAQMISENRR
ncbi:MAG: acetylxylan esterase [Verrucomicrobiota bacterium]